MAEESPSRAPLAVPAPVVEVTLFEDRARVVRRGSASLPAGTARVRVEGVAPVLSDRTLTVAVDPAAEGARALDARVVRRVVTRPPEGSGAAAHDLERLERERDALDRELARLDGAVGLLERQSRSLDALGELTLAEIAEDVAWARSEPEEWDKRLERLREQARAAQQRLADLRYDRDAKRADRDRLEQRIQAARDPSAEEWAAIEAEVEVPAAGPYGLRFEYVVPGACWRPHHTARLHGGPAPRVEFRTDGCVWQNTGEEWRDVRLRFSTQRPSLGTDPPPLASDVLEVVKKPEEIAVETREQEVATSGLGGETGAASPRLPGIDDGGEAVNLAARATATVPSDGRAYRVPLLGFETEAEASTVAVPELVRAALLRTVQTNRGPAPILAGPVDLIRDGGFAGRTSVLYVATGERFPLGWGPEQDLRVQRDTEVTRDKQRLLTSWDTRRHRATVRLSNVGPRPCTVKVTERVPVSEIDKVVVEPDPKETTDGRAPNPDGFLEWTVDLAPHQHKALMLRYTLKKHDDVKGL
jgi:uncharacterized protein (TIGR02231 family)